MLYAMAGVLVGSVILNIFFLASHKRDLEAARKTNKYKRLRSRLYTCLNDWERQRECQKCGGEDGKHYLSCPVMVIRFTMDKVEQTED